ncbi:MAG TPA: HAD family hydrolase [Vicinamibacterales bacterium]|nr:HAD family hydrolase [Vicinamibacterales bacterium]
MTPANLNSGVERDLVFAGLIGMIDPPRDEARDAVARAKGAGIRPVMITGDHPKTAAVIAQELGIVSGGRAVTGAELEGMSAESLDRTVGDVSVYARVNPEHRQASSPARCSTSAPPARRSSRASGRALRWPPPRPRSMP